MKFSYTDAEEAYLRDRRDAAARPGTNLLVGMLLSAAAATAVALLPRELSFGERAYATKAFEPGLHDDCRIVLVPTDGFANSSLHAGSAGPRPRCTEAAG